MADFTVICPNCFYAGDLDDFRQVGYGRGGSDSYECPECLWASYKELVNSDVEDNHKMIARLASEQ